MAMATANFALVLLGYSSFFSNVPSLPCKTIFSAALNGLKHSTKTTKFTFKAYFFIAGNNSQPGILSAMVHQCLCSAPAKSAILIY